MAEDDTSNANYGEEVLSQDQQDLAKIVKNIKSDLWGILHLGSDGVLRSLTAEREVIDAVRLPTRLIQAMLERQPFNQELEDKFRGVDGSNVSDEQMWHPDRESLPPPLVRERRAEAEKALEEAKKMMEERKQRGEDTRCRGPVVRSSYNLDPK